MENKIDKVAFFGLHAGFDFFRIGGCESIVRRLSIQLSKKGKKVYVLTYENEEANTQKYECINIIRVKELTDALNYIETNAIKDVVSISLGWGDKFKINKWLLTNKIRIHYLITNYKPNILKRVVSALEASVTCRRGKVFVISERLKKGYFFRSNLRLVPPPVDDSFFFNHDESLENAKYRIAFMGRLDYGKGADIAIDFFKSGLLPKDQFEFFVYGYTSKFFPESLELHKIIINDREINYIETKHETYSKKADEFLKEVGRKTDIFLLPYRFMHSSIDTPLVPLELIAQGKLLVLGRFDELNDYLPDVGLFLKDNSLAELKEQVLFATNNIESIKNKLKISVLNQKTKSSKVAEQFINYLEN